MLQRKGGQKRYYKRDYKRRYAIAKRPRPHKSIYDADVYIKCEHIAQAAVQGNIFYLQMRTNITTSAGNDYTYIDTTEFQQFAPLYAYAELRGMKMEWTAAQVAGQTDRVITSAELYGGNTHDVPSGSAPNIVRLQGMDQRVVGNLQGQMSSMYVNVYKYLKTAGRPTSVSRLNAYPADDDYGIVLYGSTAGFGNGNLVGTVRMTFFVCLKQRKYTG